ncbi:hypothetical protein TNCV_2971421 [Trichonephila clavipes]|nr:hypothetical protein TNCV_2971421 [Trichonephila clavipes]
MRTRTYCAHPSMRDHWTLRCMKRCPDQVVSLKRNPQCFKSPNMFSNKVVCEGDRLRLRCHRNLRIVIYSAAFGATHYGVPECPQPEGEGRIEGMSWRGGKYSPAPMASAATTHNIFGPTDLTSTYSVCTRGLFGGTGIKPRPSGLESYALTTRLK